VTQAYKAYHRYSTATNEYQQFNATYRHFFPHCRSVLKLLAHNPQGWFKGEVRGAAAPSENSAPSLWPPNEVYDKA